MTVRTAFLGTALSALVVSSLHAQAPQAPPTLAVASQLQGQFASARRQFTALADRMPPEFYAFKPTPEMRTFAGGVGHVIAANFSYCANLTGQPAPHKGEDFEKTVTTKDDATRLLKESFDFCAQYTTGLTPATFTATYEASSQNREGQKTKILVERGGLLATYIAHTNEMYGYLAVYLRLKGLVPPSSDPRPAPGRSGGAGR